MIRIICFVFALKPRVDIVFDGSDAYKAMKMHVCFAV